MQTNWFVRYLGVRELAMKPVAIRALGRLLGLMARMAIGWAGWHWGVSMWLGLPDLSPWQFVVLSSTAWILVSEPGQWVRTSKMP